MPSCVIFCAGEFDGLLRPIQPQDYILAADGGLTHLKQLHVTPHQVLGDFDSLGYTPAGATVFPVEKDDTDSMLAIRQGLSLGYDRFILYGCLGGKRLDHTIANLQALEFLAQQGGQGVLVGKDQLVTVVRNGSLRFHAGATGVISLFCMGADAEGVTLEGLQYPLEKSTLTAGFPLGVSNHFTGSAARITVEKGSLLAVFDRENHIYCEDLL